MRTEPSFSAEPDDRLADIGDGYSSESESTLLSDYRHRYGLSVDPFADDPHFPFYTGAQRRQVLDQLLHLCQFSNNLLLIAGEYGVGKTRMAQALIDSLDDADDICFLEGQVTSSYDALIADVLAQFELPDAESLSEFIQKDSRQEGLVIVIVDNAHHLSDDVLLDLIALQNDDARLHLVLFAESHLLSRIENFDVPDRVLSDFYLDKLSLAESVDYLNFRMEMADYLGPEIFSESNVEPWWRQAQGNLLQLHERAQEKLLAAAPAAKSYNATKKGLPLPHIIAASVLGAGLLMGFIYWGGSSPSTKQATEVIPVPLGKDLSSGEFSSAAASGVAIGSNLSTASGASVPLNNANSTVAPANSAANAPDVTPASPAEVVKQSVVPLAETSRINSEQISSAIKVGANTANSATANIGSVRGAAPSPKETKKVEPSSEPKAITKTNTSVAEKPKPTTGASSFSDQEKILLSWGESEYTLQLVGVSSEKAVREFVADQPNKKELLVFKTVRQGKDWFVVVTGRYPTSAKARQAAQLLPESEKKAAPWPRELKVIQREIRSASK